MSSNRRPREKLANPEEALEDRDLIHHEDEEEPGREDLKIQGEYLSDHEDGDYREI